MKKTWVLIANAQRARCFERQSSDHSLVELADFVHPSPALGGTTGAATSTGALDKGHGRTGHAGTQFEPHTEAHAKERRSFARQLADYLDTNAATQQYSTLVLMASSQMLGELRPYFSIAVEKALDRCIAVDLTRYQGAELKDRVSQALQLPD